MCRYLAFIFLFALLFLGCSEQIKPEPATYSQLLTGKTSKTWKLSSFYIIDRATDIKYRFSTDNSCTDSIDYMDNYYVFHADAGRTLEILEGPERCSYKSTDSYLQDSWELDNGKATLSMIFLPLIPDVRAPYIIKELTDSKLLMEFFIEKNVYQFVLNPVEGE